MQLRVQDLKARIERLGKLVEERATEAGMQAGHPGVLLDREHRQYLAAVQQTIAGADDARVVLARAVKRLEGGRVGRPRPSSVHSRGKTPRFPQRAAGRAHGDTPGRPFCASLHFDSRRKRRRL
jgi:hypothetical protein